MARRNERPRGRLLFLVDALPKSLPPRTLRLRFSLWKRTQRQVFGLTGIFHFPTGRRFPAIRQCLMTAFVPAYRCGAVPDSHRVPFSLPDGRPEDRW